MYGDGRKLVSPIIEYDEYGRQKAIYQIGEGGDFEEIITKNTPQAVRGNQIWTRVGGYDLFTDINNTIIIDKRGANILVLGNKIEDEITPVNEREYLLLLVGAEDTEFEDTFRGIVGRQNVFDTVVGIVDLIDMHESKILAETTQLKGAITVWDFMKMCVDKDLVENPTGFDPYEYEDVLYEEDI